MAGLALWGLRATVTTRQGVNFTVSNKPIPLYVKMLDFLHRDAHYRLLARQITAGLSSDEQRALAVFDWTRRTIRPTPPGWPVTDDHILHIIIREHGVSDQFADVFATLTTYAGVPAFWKAIRLSEPGGGELVLSFVRLGDRWVVFDVWRGLIFTDEQGSFLSADQLAADPQRADALVGTLQIGTLPYSRYFSQPTFLKVPELLRAQLQMPWPRLAYEMRRALHLAPQTEAARLQFPDLAVAADAAGRELP
ncbi:MAG: hypothetical protein COV75_02290 [Candidatus Omnitrophica bacterium CG11_big_fil_rev_8_21_14_0_20_63_9]|nr:MAG: hypothetical protein COV75_02290 [Candidatus Omnitrophica bacterium CG11_big_fil_rev_8_21_14_0_20_63_9]